MIEHLRSLAVFAKVVELGSFRAAARARALAPAGARHPLREREARLSTTRLYRTTRRRSLTPEGEKLARAARAMIDAAERGLDAVSGKSASPTGHLRLTAPAFLAQTAFSADLAGFSTEHPNVRLTVSFTDAPRDLLRDNLDLALRIGKLTDSTHKTRKLADMHRVVVTSPRYLRARRAPEAPSDVAAWDYLHLASRPAEITLTAGGKKKPVTISFTPKLSSDSAAALRDLVVAGAGVTALPEVLVREDLTRGRLVALFPSWRAPLVGVYAMWPNNAPRGGLTLRFVDFMAGRVAALFAPPG